MSRRGSRVDEPAAYHAEGILYLPAEARFDYLLNRPEAENIGAKVDAAMRDVAKCEVRVANVEVQSVRQSKFVIRHSPIPASLDYDAFGRIYERGECRSAKCELRSAVSSTVETRHSQFARSPSSIVRLLTEVIEPYHGRILDPACGSGGMEDCEVRSPSCEVQSIRHSTFVIRHLPRLSIHGVEKTNETGRLCRLNLAVHGLESEIKHGGNINSYYDDPHDATGRFDFVLADRCNN